MYLRKTKILFFALFTILLTNACNNSYYRKEELIQNNLWQIENIKEFEFSIDDKNSKYDIYIEIENNNQYNTSNLWLYLDSELPDAKLQKDTVMFLLSDDNGKPYGEISGDNVTSRFLYKKDFTFPQTGKYKFRIKHGMREKDLPALNKICLEIEKAVH